MGQDSIPSIQSVSTKVYKKPLPKKKVKVNAKPTAIAKLNKRKDNLKKLNIEEKKNISSWSESLFTKDITSKDEFHINNHPDRYDKTYDKFLSKFAKQKNRKPPIAVEQSSRESYDEVLGPI